MTQRNSVLPSVNGRQDASFLNYRSNPSHKQHHSADILWKNPPLKFPKKSCHLERRKRYLGEQRRDLFLGYEVSTPQLRETGKGNRPIEINEFVRSYVHKRESQLPLLKPSQRTLVQRNNIVPDCLFVSKRPREINLPTLEFTEEVIASRADPCLSSYFSVDMKKIYNLDGLSISKKQKKKSQSKANAKRIFPQKHKLCMPRETSKDLVFTSKARCSWRKELHETTTREVAGKVTHLWEKYVLGLISKQTAQWIANQCSTGEQRSRLIDFLDEKYNVEDVARDGAGTVFKILSINDDAVSPPFKREKQTIVDSEAMPTYSEEV